MNDPLEGFSSFIELQRRHDELLERQAEFERQPGPDASGFWSEVQAFVGQARATGAVLDTSRDRRAAQSILNYWANSLYRAGYDTPPVHLASFDPALAPELPDSPAPYRGLAAFETEDADFFFGRDRLVQALTARIDQGDRFLAVVGASGSGKSSVVLAGLLPALGYSQQPHDAGPRFAVLAPGAKPLQNLANALSQTLQQSPGAEGSAGEEALSLSTADLADHSTSVLRLIQDTTGAPLVLVVDQFEELFTLCKDEEERKAFIDFLLAFCQDETPPHVVVVTMRTDFVDNVVRIPELDAVFRAGRVDVYPLDINELRAAIEGPAARVGLQFDEGIVDDLISKILGERAGLPLLQFTLTRLWENRQRNRITREVYAEVGHPLQALERSAESFYQRLLPEERTTLRRILLRMVHFHDGQEITSQRIPVENLFQNGEAHDRVERVLNRLIEQERLVKLSAGQVQTQSAVTVSGKTVDGEVAQVEIAHEALIRNWPRLVGWLEDERHKVRRRQRIHEDAAHWHELGREPGALYSGIQLAEVQRVVAESDQPLSPLEEAFLAASQQEIDREKEEEIARRVELERAQERAEQQARRSRRLVWLSIVLLVLALIPTLLLLLELSMRQSEWKRAANLPGDSVTRLAAAAPPDHPPRYCIGTVHMGVACSTDGDTWNIYQANLPTGGLARASESALRGINALAIDAVNPDLLYVFLWEKGIYKSEDGGVSWQSANKPLPRDAVVKLAAHSGAAAAVIQEAGTRARSLHVSLDGGESWNLMEAFTREGYGTVNDIVFVPATSATRPLLLAATDTGIYASPAERNGAWQQRIDLPFTSLLAVGNSLDDGFYIATREDRTQSRLYFWQPESGLREVTSFEHGVRSLAAHQREEGLLTIYLLLDNNEVFAIAPTGEPRSLGKPPASLLDFELDYAFRIAVFSDRTGESTRLWLAHTKGLFERRMPTNHSMD